MFTLKFFRWLFGKVGWYEGLEKGHGGSWNTVWAATVKKEKGGLKRE